MTATVVTEFVLWLRAGGRSPWEAVVIADTYAD